MQPSLTTLSLPFVSSLHCCLLPSTISHTMFCAFPHAAQSASSQATVYLRAWSFVCSPNTRHEGQQTVQRNPTTAPAASSTPERVWKHHSLRRSQQRPQPGETSLGLTLSSPWADGNSRLSLARSILYRPSIRENRKLDQKGEPRSPCLQLCVLQCPVAANSFLPPPSRTSPVWQQWVVIDSPGSRREGWAAIFWPVAVRQNNSHSQFLQRLHFKQHYPCSATHPCPGERLALKPEGTKAFEGQSSISSSILVWDRT